MHDRAIRGSQFSAFLGAPMPGPTASELADTALDLGLITQRQYQEIWGHFGTHNISPNDLLQFMVRRGLLTNYQVDRLLKGDRTGYFYGDYKVLYLVGSGSFARVFRAVHKDTGQVVAVKVLRRRYSDNAKMASHFVREGELGKTLRHPNIVPVYEACSLGSDHFLVMEFVEGRNLKDFVKIRRRVDPLEATKLMIDVTNGLRYAFERGITHRDLKMTNVLVSSRGQAKLVDFGLAADEGGEASDRRRSPRTVEYAALESATGVEKGDPRSDIYFLGCIYYHMLIGRSPLPESRDRMQRLSRRMFVEVLPIQDVDRNIPRCVSVVVNKCMKLDADQRYQTPTEVLFDLGLAKRELSGEGGGERQLAARLEEQQAPAAETEQSRDTILVVEANTRMQNVFREGLRRSGYRVLITTDPERAFARFREEDTAPASCVIINAQDIGRPAVAIFNRFAEEPITKEVPAILLLDQNQGHLRSDAAADAKHMVLSMPLKMKDLRAAIERLLSPT